MRVASLAAVLFAFWLALSGHYTLFLTTLGFATSVFVALLAWRMRIADDEGHPIELLLAAVTYWPWLVGQILGSAASVSRIILTPSLPISPTATEVEAAQRTAAGIATYANSITLTPGTVTIGVAGNRLTVLGLTRANVLDLEAGAMDARVRSFEGTA